MTDGQWSNRIERDPEMMQLLRDAALKEVIREVGETAARTTERLLLNELGRGEVK